MSLYREYILRVPLEVEIERYEYINERATAFLGYPILEEVVRCRDCRYNEDESDRWDGTLTELYGEPSCYCMHPDGNGDYMRMEVEPDGFCKWGEPK